MKNIINLSLLNIKRDKSKIKIYIIIMTIFISLINILLNTSIILNESINSIYINKKNIYVDYEMISKNAKMIFDTKNVMKDIKKRDNLEVL